VWSAEHGPATEFCPYLDAAPRPTLIVPFAAHGGTDLVPQAFAAALNALGHARDGRLLQVRG